MADTVAPRTGISKTTCVGRDQASSYAASVSSKPVDSCWKPASQLQTSQCTPQSPRNMSASGGTLNVTRLLGRHESHEAHKPSIQSRAATQPWPAVGESMKAFDPPLDWSRGRSQSEPSISFGIDSHQAPIRMQMCHSQTHGNPSIIHNQAELELW